MVTPGSRARQLLTVLNSPQYPHVCPRFVEQSHRHHGITATMNTQNGTTTKRRVRFIACSFPSRRRAGEGWNCQVVPSRLALSRSTVYQSEPNSLWASLSYESQWLETVQREVVPTPVSRYLQTKIYSSV